MNLNVKINFSNLKEEKNVRHKMEGNLGLSNGAGTDKLGLGRDYCSAYVVILKHYAIEIQLNQIWIRQIEICILRQ
jgi:hypothetical protein